MLMKIGLFTFVNTLIRIHISLYLSYIMNKLKVLNVDFIIIIINTNLFSVCVCLERRGYGVRNKICFTYR